VDGKLVFRKEDRDSRLASILPNIVHDVTQVNKKVPTSITAITTKQRNSPDSHRATPHRHRSHHENERMD
jgi:hypothetical protein